MAEKVYSFQECLKKGGSNQRAVLLGNGFSIALFPKIFSYSSLRDRADFEKGSPVQRLFDAIGTADFEAVLRHLTAGHLVGEAYGVDPAVRDLITADIASVRDKLVGAIAGIHPPYPHEITDSQYKSCRKFLRNFPRIYSLYYDLLLYWAIMHGEADGKPLEADDGFRTPPDDPKADFVTWEAHHIANVHFLHGVLHLFDAGAELRKYTWVRTGIPLMAQIRTALDNQLYPLFVAEGTSSSKIERIMHHAYLHRAFRSFENIGGALYVHGHSLSASDDHIFDLLRRCDNKIVQLFVSLHGDQSTPSNQNIILKARAIEAARAKCRRTLDVSFYDSDSADVWND
jgi:hypothetical protein